METLKAHRTMMTLLLVLPLFLVLARCMGM
jgi:hypothetical protein